MRTSAHQFEMMVNYMEQNGDINKPSRDSRDKIKSIEKWDFLTTLLNSDGSGGTKSVERWKKVWSDLKNNTKKKAAKISRAALRSGGGTACTARLAPLEQRVMQIIGSQAAIDTLAEAEARLPQTEEDTSASIDEDPIAILSEAEHKNQTSNARMSENEETPTKAPKRRLQPDLIRMTTQMEETFNKIRHYTEQRNVSEQQTTQEIDEAEGDDECTIFGVLVAKKLRKLSEERRDVMMVKINQLFVDERQDSSH